MSLNRREFCRLSSSSMLAGLAFPSVGFADKPDLATQSAPHLAPLETFVPTRAITRGPIHHWFGYYDKHEFDSTGQFVLANEVDFEGRSPTADDKIGVGFVDTHNNDIWTSVGTSNAWGWQQGCMLQWVGSDGDKILWNDREGDSFVCRVYSRSTGSVSTLSRPIYTVSPDGRFGLSADFRRINNLRPGYGYTGLSDPCVAQRAPPDSGVWKVDLDSGREELILSLADVAAIPWLDGTTHDEAWHYFNHLLINPSGTRFIVLHRYRPKFDPQTLRYDGGFVTRMFTANMDGSDRYVLDPSGKTSHFIWKNDKEVTMWTKPAGKPERFYTFADQTQNNVVVGPDTMTVNGHNTYLPAPYDDWILNDTYPDNKTSRQTVYLFHTKSGRRVDLGHFPSGPDYRGEWRCDTHPRSNRAGTHVAIDSPHESGRQVYLMDIRSVLEA
ncbi:hypothetical protein Poly51_50290 [Rubripirellula tenax]|uniref:Uncharacterized protein n=1 Tax=Rubripirellula tenax TaxID=2528015 RepID=A0A5C6EF71_9BACT|nr:hypothetical protein [Rubripirellula tenax]TWU47230.1 hypothetical protein Poly51_50290 [Rubripirellula tenax]